MHCRLIAAGTRLPEWINTGFRDYQQRLRKPLTLELQEIPLGARSAGKNPRTAMAEEGGAMRAALRDEDYVVALQVDAPSMSTPQLGAWLARRLQDGKPLALLIGGPDGLAPPCLERADFRWSLSPLTLPHALVRIIVAEQLYRGMSLLAGHPYHRA